MGLIKSPSLRRQARNSTASPQTSIPPARIHSKTSSLQLGSTLPVQVLIVPIWTGIICGWRVVSSQPTSSASESVITAQDCADTAAPGREKTANSRISELSGWAGTDGTGNTGRVAPMDAGAEAV